MNMRNVNSSRWNDETYTKALPHFGFILHESKMEKMATRIAFQKKMATRKAATAATLSAVFAVEDDSETTKPLNVQRRT